MFGGRGLVDYWQTVNADGDPVLTMCCDCGTTTVLTVAGAAAAEPGTELAVTCDGCLTVRWLTIVELTL
jgi:hypothetical protein